jgi:hypothetical protein
MTSKIYYKAMFEDIRHERCSEHEIKTLIGYFESLLKTTATTLARRSDYEMRDFSLTKERGVSEFSLTIEKRFICDIAMWHGTFRHGEKNLEIIATLEAS